MAYPVLLLVHSWLRWGVLALGLLALALAIQGWRSGRAWTPVDRRVQLWFTIFFDVQIAAGIALYIVSPIREMLSSGAVMRSGELRFFALEHPILMLAAAAALHVLSSRSRRAPEPRRRHRTWAIGVIAALALAVVAIPWPFLPWGRPLFGA